MPRRPVHTLTPGQACHRPLLLLLPPPHHPSLQGIVGSTPWNALVFNTLYLQLLGFSDFQSSLVAALFLGGTAFGAQAGTTPHHHAEARSPAVPPRPSPLRHCSRQ